MSSNKALNCTAVITDASCIIILQKLSALNLLYQLFTSVYTTPEIAAECDGDLPAWLTIIKVKNEKLQREFCTRVDAGEASAIALAYEVEIQFLITDDLKARKLSLSLGLPVIGTLGILLRAKHDNHIDFVKPFLEKMRTTDFRVSDELYHAVLDKAGEL